MRTWLVTGGAGFIGSHFIRMMLEGAKDLRIVNLDKLTYAGRAANLQGIAEGPRYRFVRGDICDPALVSSLLARERISVIVNFAAESHVDRSIENATDFARTNVTGVLNLLDCARRYWARGEGYVGGVRFLQVSTDEVYGALPLEGGKPFAEEDGLCPRSPYAASKAAADLFVMSYWETHRLPVCISRCCNNYGPGQYPEKLIPLCIARALDHQTVPIYGDGKNVREWIHVRDHCRALLAVLQRGRPGEIYHVGSGLERDNLTIVRTVLSLLARKDEEIGEGLIEFVADRKGHDRRYAINCDKTTQALGWQAKIPFDAGLAQTVGWYAAHPEACRP